MVFAFMTAIALANEVLSVFSELINRSETL
jgi:hypothetical protein